MNKSVAFTALALLTLAFGSTADASPPDRCAELGRDGYPSYCEPGAAQLAPLWGDEVCCDGGFCMETDPTYGCPTGTQSYECKYAEWDQGRVTCLFIVPNYCDEHECETGSCDDGALDFQSPPQEQFICCEWGVCVPTSDVADCMGEIQWCENGVSNPDGTVTCFDKEPSC